MKWNSSPPNENIFTKDSKTSPQKNISTRLTIFSQLFFILFFLSSQLLGQAQTVLYPELSGQDLINQLKLDYTPSTVLGYDDARDVMYSQIDNDNNNVTCVYSGYTIYLDPDADPSTDAYNKDINAEHTWPQSMGTDNGNARSDMHHLYPARAQVNSSRGNDPFDEIADSQTDKWWRNDSYLTSIPASNISEYSEKDNNGRFEPREDHKGNVARAMFYMKTIYGSQLDVNFFEQQKEVLRHWHNTEIVDAAESLRNDRIAPYQSNKKNPFILDSTLVRRAFFNDISGSTVLNPQNFSASAVGETQIDLSWQKNAMNNDVMIVWNYTGVFSQPVDGETYTDGQEALDGTIISRRGTTVFNHTGLTGGITHQYRAFSVNGPAGSEVYSTGSSVSAQTEGGSVAQTGDIVITEIMQNPANVTDTDGEWFEIFNKSNQAVDINGWFIKDDDGDSHRIISAGQVLVEAQSYAVLGRNANSSTNGGVDLLYQYSGIDLANAGDEIILQLPDGTTEVDRIEYDGGTAWPDPNGKSMYFNDLVSAENNNAASWSLANLPWPGSAGDLGTPGYAETTSNISWQENQVISGFKLSNFPNPFNPSTKIKYHLEKSAQVQLSVYNAAGQLIRVLVNQKQNAGEHTVYFFGKNLASGIYICTIQTADRFKSTKMILLR